jgi:hypothetical protein
VAFDGNNYTDPSLAWPILYHSDAALAGPSLSVTLEAAYFYALNHGRLLIAQHYPMNFRRPQGVRDFTIIKSSSEVRLAEGWRRLPEFCTHLVCEAIFAIVKDGGSVQVTHKLHVSNGAGSTDDGSGTVITVDPGTGNVSGFTAGYAVAGGPGYDAWAAYGPRSNNFTTRCEVALSNVTTGAQRIIWVDGYAVDATDSSAVSYMPQMYTVWAEFR